MVAVPVFDVELYLATGGGPGNGTVKIVNILGFFVDRIDPNGDVVGYLINKKETFKAGAGGIAGQASFLKQIMLIR